MTGGISQQFCVRWNSHLGSLGAAFPQLLAGQRFVDVTLACEGHQVHCHRLVLAACSSYFESLLGENPCKHPIIILPRDIKLWEIQALVDFMYKGEVNVSQAGLPDLLRCAEILQIRGLCGSDAALNLNQISPNNSSTAASHSNPSQLSGIRDNNNASTTNMITSTPNKSTQITPANPGTSSVMPNLTPSKQSGGSTTSPQQTAAAAVVATPSQSTSSIKKETIVCQPTVVMPPVNLDECEDSQNESNNSEMMDEGELKINEDYSDDNSIIKIEPELAMANVICELEGSTYASGRRVRRSETILRQAAECVSRGQTFQTVSDMFHIPISTIRFFMARKGILPRRKRGRASGHVGNSNESQSQHSSNMDQHNSRSSSPSEPPFHFAHYKLPELRPKLV